MTRFTRSALASIAVAHLAFAALTPLALAEPPPTNAPADGGQDPDNEQFDKLLEAQKRYAAIAQAGGWPALPDGEPMKPGERYDCARIQALEKRLEVEGYRAHAGDAPAEPAETPKASAKPEQQARAEKEAGGDKGTPAADTGAASNCEYRSDLAEAVKDFQHDRYLTSDGIVGGQTQARLAKPVDDVLAKIDYALKRWRANAANLSGSYIVVNIPAFELAVYEGRRETLRMPVIVGLPDWQTPEMSDKIETIVVNPSWGIPKSIAAAEVLP